MHRDAETIQVVLAWRRHSQLLLAHYLLGDVILELVKQGNEAKLNSSPQIQPV